MPRLHLIRYHGVLAPHAADRDLIVPAANATDGAAPATANTVPLSPVQRLKWAQLLARMLSLDITICPRCGGTMRLVAALTDPHSIRTYLTGVGLPADPPPISSARPPPQRELDCAA